MFTGASNLDSLRTLNVLPADPIGRTARISGRQSMSESPREMRPTHRELSKICSSDRSGGTSLKFSGSSTVCWGRGCDDSCVSLTWESHETDRLRLTRMTDDDTGSIHEIYSDPATWTHLPSGRFKDRHESEQMLESSDRSWRQAGLGQWSVRLRTPWSLQEL